MLVSSYGVTRRGMTQCISASLLEFDRWSRPNVTVLSLILSKDCVNFIYLLCWQRWLIGNVENASVPCSYSWCCAADACIDLWLLPDWVRRIYGAHIHSRYTHVAFIFHLFPWSTEQRLAVIVCGYGYNQHQIIMIYASISIILHIIIILRGIC